MALLSAYNLLPQLYVCLPYSSFFAVLRVDFIGASIKQFLCKLSLKCWDTENAIQPGCLVVRSSTAS